MAGMTDQPNSKDPLTTANERFAKAFQRARCPNGQLQLNPLSLLIAVEFLKINLQTLIQVAGENGMDMAAFNAAAVTALNQEAEKLEGVSPIQVAAGNFVGRKR